MKLRLSLPDVLAQAHFLRNKLLGQRLQNVYDIDGKSTFLLKFSDTGKDPTIVLIESGVRIHTTRYVRDKPMFPSGFTMKLRKHLRNRRLTSLRCVGLDRVLDFTFGSGKAAYHLIVELYDRGNVVLTDHSYTILTLLRKYALDLDDTEQGQGEGNELEDQKTKNKSKKKQNAKAQREADTRIRISVKEKYAFAAQQDDHVGSLAVGSRLKTITAALDQFVSSDVRSYVEEEGADDAIQEGMGMDEDVEMDEVEDEDEEEPTNVDPTTDSNADAIQIQSTLPESEVPVPEPQQQRAATEDDADSSKVPPPIDAMASLSVISEQLDAYIAWYEKYKYPTLPNKAKRRLTLTNLLCTRGSGVDLFGTALVEHVILSSVGNSVAPTQDPSNPASVTLVPRSILALLAKALSNLPFYLKAIATTVGTAFVKVESLPSTPKDFLFSSDGDQLKTRESLGKWSDLVEKSKAMSQESATAPAEKKEEEEKKTTPEGEEGMPSQAPAEVPLRMVDFSPFPFIQLVGYDASREALAEMGLPSFSASAPSGSITRFAVFDDFDTLVDEYFSRLDVSNAEKAEQNVRSMAAKRLERIQERHLQSIAELQAAEELATRKANLILENITSIDAVITVIRSAMQSGMSWSDIIQYVEKEAAAQHPIAQMIAFIDLPDQKVTVALTTAPQSDSESSTDEESDFFSESESDSDSDSDASTGYGSAKGRRMLLAQYALPESKSVLHNNPQFVQRRWGEHVLFVDIDINVSAANNVYQYFSMGKVAREKASRTAAAADVAIKDAEKTIAATSKRMIDAAAAMKTIRLQRKPYWFERYYWFITSEGLIVVAGKNAQDNETLVKRYLRPQDAYIHAEVHGAASCILRSPWDDPGSADKLETLSYSLQQAGAFCINLSSGWSSNIVTSAWWVYASQVSKTAPTGEYLGHGSFMIRGKKNYLPPSRLELGMALLFQVSDENIDAHLEDRKLRMEEEAQEKEFETLPVEPVAKKKQKKKTRRELMFEAELAKLEAEEQAEGGGGWDHAADQEAGEQVAEEEEETGIEESASASEDERQQVSVTNAPVPSHLRRRVRNLMRDQGLSQSDALKRAADEKAMETAEKERQEGGKKQKQGAGAGGKSQKVKQEPTKKRSTKGKRRGKYSDSESDDEVEVLMLPSGLKPKAKATPKASKEKTSPTPAETEPAPKQEPTEAPKPAPKPRKERVEEDDDELAKTSGQAEKRQLASLVGSPLPTDTLLHAIPMLAPYSVVHSYKYKVKILPGGLKKGKAGQSVLHYWSQQVGADGTAREQELLKTLGDNEMVAAIVGNCKIMPPVGTAPIKKVTNKKK